jgi:hypothetical protein
MSAIPAREREKHKETARRLFQQVKEVNAVPDGYTFTVPNDTSTFRMVAEFVANERLCCPFFTFVLESHGDGGPLTLTLKGREGVKEVVLEELGEVVAIPLPK